MIRYGLYLLVFFLPFTFWRFPFNIKISEGIALILMFYFFPLLFFRRRSIYLTPFFLPMLMVISVATLSAFQMHLIPPEIYSEVWAYGRYSPDLSSILSISRYIFLLFFVVLLTNIIKTKQILQKTLKIYIISGCVASAVGILQLLAYYTNIRILSDLTSLFSEGWYDTPLIPQYLGEIVFPRIMGPNNEPKMFANTLVTILPFTIIAIIKKWTILNRKTLWFFLFLQIAAFYFTFSASGWFVILIALLLIFIKQFKYNLKFIIISIVFFISFICGISFLIDIPMLSIISFNFERTFFYFSSPAAIGQVGPAMAGLEMFKDHPILGVGIGNFPFHFYNYNVLNLPYVDHQILASNEYISILAETGLLGAISWLPFLFVVIKFIKEANQKVLEKQNPYLLSVFKASVAATIAGWLQLWATYGIFNPHIWFPLVIAVTARRLILLENKYENAIAK